MGGGALRTRDCKPSFFCLRRRCRVLVTALCAARFVHSSRKTARMMESPHASKTTNDTELLVKRGCLRDALKSTSVELAADDALNWGPITPMRLGAALFAMPLYLAISREHPLGSMILAVVMLTTIPTHRPRKAWCKGLREDIDSVAVTLWCMYNTFLTGETIHSFVAYGYTPGRVVMLVLALAGAAGCVVLNRCRERYPYRSRRRDALHVTMQLSGAAGTCFLIEAAR